MFMLHTSQQQSSITSAARMTKTAREFLAFSSSFGHANRSSLNHIDCRSNKFPVITIGRGFLTPYIDKRDKCMTVLLRYESVQASSLCCIHHLRFYIVEILRNRCDWRNCCCQNSHVNTSFLIQKLWLLNPVYFFNPSILDHQINCSHTGKKSQVNFSRMGVINLKLQSWFVLQSSSFIDTIQSTIFKMMQYIALTSIEYSNDPVLNLYIYRVQNICSSDFPTRDFKCT